MRPIAEAKAIERLYVDNFILIHNLWDEQMKEMHDRASVLNRANYFRSILDRVRNPPVLCP